MIFMGNERANGSNEQLSRCGPCGRPKNSGLWRYQVRRIDPTMYNFDPRFLDPLQNEHLTDIPRYGDDPIGSAPDTWSAYREIDASGGDQRRGPTDQPTSHENRLQGMTVMSVDYVPFLAKRPNQTDEGRCIHCAAPANRSDFNSKVQSLVGKPRPTPSH